MFSALAKHQFPRASAFQITRLTRASVHAKAQTTVKAQEQYYVSTSFPDDFESSPLKLDEVQKQDQATGSKASATVDKAATERHLADIYESLFPKDPLVAMKKAKAKGKAPKEAEQEPSLDEM